MKCLIIAIFAVVVVIEAKPYGYYGPGYGYNSGGSFGNSGFLGGHNGYLDQGYGGGLVSSGHDIGHHENDFDSAVHQHQSDGHDIGNTLLYGNGGHNAAGYQGYNAGHNGYGSGWNNGYGGGFF